MVGIGVVDGEIVMLNTKPTRRQNMATEAPKEKARRKSKTAYTSALYVRLNQSTYDALMAEADRRLISHSLIVDRAVTEWLDREAPPIIATPSGD